MILANQTKNDTTHYCRRGKSLNSRLKQIPIKIGQNDR